MTQHEFYVQSLIIWTALSVAVGAGVVLYRLLRRPELPKRTPGGTMPPLADPGINGERLNDQEWADWLLARDAFDLPAAVRADDTAPPPGAHDGDTS